MYGVQTRVLNQAVKRNIDRFSGTYVNAIIEVSGQKTTALPSEAIVSFEDKNYIFVYEKEQMEGGKCYRRRPPSDFQMYWLV